MGRGAAGEYWVEFGGGVAGLSTQSVTASPEGDHRSLAMARTKETSHAEATVRGGGAGRERARGSGANLVVPDSAVLHAAPRPVR